MAIEGKGSLVVVGTGIQLINQMTHEARGYIERAEKVYYVVADPAMERWLKTLNSSAESLSCLYEDGKSRRITYTQMVEAILTGVRKGYNVCAVFYGHPGVFVTPSHEAIKLAREEGFEARMLPGISAEDCLFADLGVDPGTCGCQSFEASDFLVRRRRFDPTSTLILWQIGAIGHRIHKADGYSNEGLKILVEVLSEHYGDDHEVVVYVASPFPYPVARPHIQRMKLSELPDAKVLPPSTLYVPPMPSTTDPTMSRRLNLDFNESR